MYILHRQGDRSVFWDVFMWTDNPNYIPTDDDYKNATEMKAGQPVESINSLATTWGAVKAGR